MSEIIDVDPVPSPASATALPPAAAGPDALKLAQLKQLTLVVYALYGLSFFVGITALVAIVINYVKRPDTAGTIYASHFTWQIRTFWWTVLWTVIGFATILLGVGFVVLFAAFVWMVYRLVKGFLNLNEDKPMEVG